MTKELDEARAGLGEQLNSWHLEAESSLGPTLLPTLSPSKFAGRCL